MKLFTNLLPSAKQSFRFACLLLAIGSLLPHATANTGNSKEGPGKGSNTCPTSVTIGFAPATYCTNTQGVLSATPIGGTFTTPTYQWTVSNGRATISSSTAPNPDIDYITTGTTLISVTVTDGGSCGTFTASQSITISSTPEPSITISTTEVCQGNTIVGITGTPNGAFRQWTVNNTGTPPTPFGTFSAAANQTTNFTANQAGNAQMFYQVTTTAGCTGISEAQPVTIFAPVVATAAVASSNQPSVCADATLALSGSATGGNGSYTYEWEYMGGTQAVPVFTTANILLNDANTQNPVLTPLPNASDGDTYIFRVKATDGVTCSDFSDNDTITVRKITSAAISFVGTSTLCAGGTTSFKVDVTRSNNSGSPTYTLVYSDGTETFTEPNYTSGATITTAPRNADYALSIVSIKDNRVTASACNSPSNGSTANVTVNNVTAGVVGSSQTICSGADVAAFTVETEATGDGTLSYQWQINTNLMTPSWSNISGATSATFDEGARMAAAQYRRITTSNLNMVECKDTSNVITVTVNNVTAGVIGSDQTICSGTDVAAFTVVTPATGDGTLSYQWQINTDPVPNWGGWSDISGATGEIYDHGALTADARFRRVTTSTIGSVSCKDTSNMVTVTVNNLSGGGIGSDQTICSGTDVAAFTVVTPATGDGTLSYQWQINTNLTTPSWSNISGANTATYDEGMLSADAQYRRVTTSTIGSVACQAESNVITVTVNNITAGTIAGDQTICAGQTASFTETNAAALDGTISYEWESSTDGTSWTSISSSNSDTYISGPLSQATQFRRKDISLLNGVECSAYTNVVTVTVITTASSTLYVNATTGDDANLGSEICPKKTIQAAVNAAVTGGTILVAAGTYTENITINGKNLVLRGPNTGLNNANATRAAEAVVTAASNAPLITLEANVTSYTIDGFKLVGADYDQGSNGRMIWSKGQNTESSIQNNVLELTSNASGTKRYIWLGGSGSVSSGSEHIKGNISHNQFVAAGTGSGFNGIITQQWSANFTIAGNKFQGTTGQRNILIWHPSITTVIENNEFFRSDAGGDMLYLGGSAPGVGTAGAVIRNNKFVSPGKAIRVFSYGGTGISVTDNDFESVGLAAIESESPPTGSVINAACNWWGSNDPAVLTTTLPSKISGNVYVPSYLDAATDASADAGFQPGGTCKLAPVRVYSDLAEANLVKAYFTIQAAINDATSLSGYVVRVEAGTFAENVTINKPLELRGIKFNQAACGRTGDESTIKGTVEVTAANVTINGFELKAIDSAPTGWAGWNVHFTSTSSVGSFLNNKVISSAPAGGYGLSSFVTFANTTGNVTATGNEFSGVLDLVRAPNALGVAGTSGDVLVSSNCFNNTGGGGSIATAGNYSGSLTITGNTIIGGGEGFFHFSGTVANLTFTNNAITGANKNGFFLAGGGSYTTGAVSNNYINGSGVSGSTFANIHLGDANNNTYGSGFVITQNDLSEPSGSNLFIKNSSGNVNAECNWYGTLNANTIASKITGNVTFSPWLVSGMDSDNTAMGFQPEPDNCSGTPVVISSATKTADAICNAGAKITVTFSGGTAPYNIAWTGGGSATNVTSPYVITGLASGSYTATITDFNGSTAASAVVVIADFPVGNESTGTGYSTIQAAINAATAGDVIKVCAGTYSENISVNKSLTLNGAHAGVKATGSARPGGESIINGTGGSSSFVVTIEADNVTIDGFKVELRNLARDGINTRTGSPVLPATTALRTGITLKNNWVYANLPDRTNQLNGIVFGEHTSNTAQAFSAEINNVTIEDNYIDLTSTSNNATPASTSITGARGIVFTNMFRNSSASLTYNNLVVDDNTVFSTYNTIIQAQLQTRLFGAQFTNNTIGNSRSGPNLPTLIGGSVFSNNTIQNINPGSDYYSNLAGAYLGVVNSTVQGNKFKNIGGTACLVIAGGRSGDLTYFPASNNSTVSNNFFIYNDQALSSLASYTSAILVEPNTVAAAVNVNGWLTGRQSGTTGADAATITVSNNSMVNGGFNPSATTYAISQESVNKTLVATCNWYGVTSSADVASKISGSVDYSPFLTDGTDADVTTMGFQPVSGACLGGPVQVYADATATVVQSAHGGIQEAIDAATTVAGNEIRVDAGTYNETVNISKSVTLKSRATTPTDAIIKGGGGSAEADAVVRFSANNATLEGFTIDRDNSASDNRAIAPMLSSGTLIKGNKIVNAFRGIQGDFYGRPTGLTVEGNIFEATVKYGIAGTEGMTGLAITGNTFKTSDEGIGLGLGAGVAEGAAVRTMRDAQTWNLSGGYAIRDYRTSTVYVKGGTIQNAINHGNTVADDVIEVAAGTYAENVTVNKAVTVRGPNHNVAYNGTRATEAVIDGNISISASGASFSGFEINRSLLPALTWLMQVTGAGTTVSNNIIKINTVQSSTVAGFIRLDAAGTVTFYGNELRMATPGSYPANTGINGLLTQGSGTYNITGNRFAVSGGPTTDADAVGITGGTVLFDGNVVNGDIMGGVTAYGNVGTTQITNNIISGYTTALAGIRVINCCGYNSANAAVTITGNFVQGSSGTKGIIIAAPAVDIVSLSNNSITGTATAIQHTGAGTLNAECNWYGSSVSTDIAPKIIGSVDYSPWLVDGTDTDPTGIGFQPGPMACGSAVVVVLDSKTDVTGCSGGNNGAIDITASGGTGTYTFAWTGPGTYTSNQEDLTGLVAGTYSLTVTDGDGNFANLVVILSQPDGLMLTTSVTGVSCNGGSNGSATVVATGGTSGSGGYTYSWNTVPAQTTATATDLAVGSYTVTVTDANNCTATATVAITQPTPLTASITSSTNVSCFSGSNGSATVMATGGTSGSGYTYSWNTVPAQTTATATGLATGDYTVTVTDANNCTATATVTITQPAEIILAIDGKTNVSCNGGSNGIIDLGVTGGTVPFTYDWSNDGSENPDNDPQDLSGLAAGTYTVTVTDANGCTSTTSAEITQPGTLTLSISKTDVSCRDGNNGTATATPSGGTSPYTYDWSGTPVGDGTATITGLIAGSYSVTVTDAKGCTATDLVTIIQPAVLAITASPSNTTATGGSCLTESNVLSQFNAWNTGVTATGGAGPLTTTANYVVTSSANNTNSVVYNGNTPTPPPADGGNTTVTWTVMDNCGKTATTSATFTVPNCMRVSGNITYYRDDAGVEAGVAFAGPNPSTVMSSGSTGAYSVFTSVAGGNYSLTPSKLVPGLPTTSLQPALPSTGINSLNSLGINVHDVQAIQAHIGAGTQFSNIYQRVAANVVLGTSTTSLTNNRLTTADATALSQAINGRAVQQIRLGWRFIPSDSTLTTGAPNPLPRSWGLVPAGTPGSTSTDAAQYGIFPIQRNYNPLNGPWTGQNYTAVLVGDVVADPTPSANSIALRYAAMPLVWRVNDAVLRAGQTIEATFRAEQLTELKGWQFGLHFDPEYLQVEDLSTADVLSLDPEVNFGLYQAEQGDIRSLWADAEQQSLNKGESVFTLRFKVLQDGPSLSKVLRLDNEVQEGYALTKHLDRVSVLLAFDELPKLPLLQSPVLHQNTPNPFGQETQIRFELPSDSNIELSIHDVNGRLIKSIKGFYSQGLHEVRFGRGEIGKYTGVLLYTLRSGEFTATRRMVVID